MKNIVETKQISKHYGNHKALDRVSIHVRPGEIYGLIGKNGAGKSNLFKVLMDLTKTTSGEKFIFGEHSINELKHLHKNVGFMMTPSFFPYLTAKQNLEYSRKVKGIQDENEIERILKIVDLHDVKKKVKSFSMGMKQRLNIANALMGNPDLILMDEPINGLDPQGMASFRKVVQKLSNEHGITFIVSSHILGELGLMATRFGFIHNGQLIEEIDADVLRDKTEDQVIIKVDNTELAAAKIEQHFEGIDYIVNEGNEMIVRSHTERIDEIANLLVSEGFHLYQLTPHKKTLEEYYLSMVEKGVKEYV